MKVYGVNDSPFSWNGNLRYGIFNMAGGLPVDEKRPVTIPANNSVMLSGFPANQWRNADLRKSGVYAILEKEGKTIAQYRLFAETFKDLVFSKPVVKISKTGDTVTFRSDVFIWGACIDTDGEINVPDNCFDIIPGIPYTIPLTKKELPKNIFCGNDLFL